MAVLDGERCCRCAAISGFYLTGERGFEVRVLQAF